MPKRMVKTEFMKPSKQFNGPRSLGGNQQSTAKSLHPVVKKRISGLFALELMSVTSDGTAAAAQVPPYINN